MFRSESLLSVLLLCLLPVVTPSAQAQFIQQGGPLTFMNGGVALSADGNTAIVGDFGHAGFTGGVLIFTRTNGTWSQQGSELVGSGAVPSQGFVSQGSAVALSADGNTALVGGPFDGGDNRGAVWVFTRSNGLWVQQGAKLVGSGAVSDAMEGDAVALSADGNTALVGNGSTEDGVYVFTRSNGVWSQQGGALTGTLTGCFDAVALSGDGNTVLVGNFCDGTVGATLVYARNGATWSQQAKLVGTGAAGDSFQGRSVTLSADGNTALVGGYADNNDAGGVWVFTRNGVAWSQQGGKIVVADAVGPAPPEFGHSVAISGDGSTALVVGPADGNYTGATWAFRRSNGTWSEQSKIIFSGAAGSAAISNDGSTVILGEIQAVVYTQAVIPAGQILLTLETYKGPDPQTCSSTVQISNSFSPADITVNVFWVINGMSPTGGDTVTLHWINPSNVWTLTSNAGPTTNTGSSTRCFFVDSNIAQYIAPNWGQWQVQVYVNNNSVGSPYSFQVISIPVAPVFSILKTHTGNFTQGQNGATYAITVANSGTAATNGQVTVTENIPSGLSLVSMSGQSWNCPPSGNTCTRSDTLNPGASYSAITVTANVAANAPASVNNQATVSGGGASSQIATDPTTIVAQGGMSGAQFVQQGSKLVGTGAVGSSLQGVSVALSADGNTAIVGGPDDANDAGAAWVYTRSGGIWSQEGSKLVGAGAAGNSASQGMSVALSADGNTAIMGGSGDNAFAGAAWVFTRSGGVWNQQGSKLVGTGAVGSSFQGSSVALSADGNTAIVGGLEDANGAGAAWVYTRSGGIWRQQGGKLVGTGGVGSSLQGFSVALSADGNTAMVGGSLDANDAGAAWVFTQSGGAWNQQGSKLVGTGAVGSSFQGGSVALSADGNTAIMGGSGDNAFAGAAWVFTRSGGVWNQQSSKLVGNGAVGSSNQGESVALSADGNTAIVGGFQDANGAGAAWVFTRSGGVWNQQGSKLVGTGAVGNAAQGRAVALSADGNTALVSGINDNGKVGAAWAFVIAAVLQGTPGVVSINPVVSTGSSEFLTFQFSDTAGWQTLGVVNILINNFLDGRQACYLAYSVPDNVLYLVPDVGSGLLPGIVLNGSSSTSNSQCTVLGSGSSAMGSGDTLTLTLNLNFNASFAGNKVAYMAARDAATNSGWQTMGAVGVSPLPSTFPNPAGMSPSSGNTISATLTFSYQDQSTATNLQTVWALINTAIDGHVACYVAYYQPGNQVFLYPDNGDGTQATSMALAGNNTISNSQCTISAQGSSVQASGNTLTVTLPISFKTSFAGFKGVWLAAQTLSGQTSPWQVLGAWNVPGN